MRHATYEFEYLQSLHQASWFVWTTFITTIRRSEAVAKHRPINHLRQVVMLVSAVDIVVQL